LPLVYVVITAVAWGDAYGQDGLCWLDSGNGGIWLFVAPALVAVVVNLVLLVRILRVVYNVTVSKGDEKSAGDIETAKRTLQAAISFGVLMVWRLCPHILDSNVTTGPSASGPALCVVQRCSVSRERDAYLTFSTENIPTAFTVRA